MINSKPNKNAATENINHDWRFYKPSRAGAAVPKVGKIISRPLSPGNAQVCD